MGVLILSAKNSLQDKIEGLGLGADDYLAKPFHFSELNARLRAIFRRRQLQGSSTINCEDIEIDTETHVVKVNDQMLDLTRKEYEMLLYFVVNKNRVLTKQSIAEHLWGDYIDALDSFDFVYQHIKNLRKKIAQAGGKDSIQTMYGSGYKFEVYQ
jgi:DNA-binding response OmpR family regulator